jgi:predicted ATPase
MSKPTPADDIGELHRGGENLAGALTFIRDQDEDAYSQLRMELNQWLPEFDAIRFKNEDGKRRFSLRQIGSKHYVDAAELSEGTLMALALLTITHQPNAPTLVGLEEPDRALHPRLLREVRDALYRLAFPTDYGLKRQPVQVIATTHSPYFLDLFRDHPEQVIVAEKKNDGTAAFRSLSDDPNLREIIGDAPLGEVWYSGVLGGVPVAK